MTSLLNTGFLLPADINMIRCICDRVFRSWGDHTQTLVDCIDFYTLVLNDVKGPAIDEDPCKSKIDLRLACDVVTSFPGKLKDFRFEWATDTTLKAEFDLFKHTKTEGFAYPEIEWVEYDPCVFERCLDEQKASFTQMPTYWGDILPMLKAIVKTIYNKAKHHPAFNVRLGVEPHSCILMFCNMDHVNYAVLSRIAQQSHLMDINTRVWEKRLDIRVKVGKATPWPQRSLGLHKHKDDQDAEDLNLRANKRARN